MAFSFVSTGPLLLQRTALGTARHRSTAFSRTIFASVGPRKAIVQDIYNRRAPTYDRSEFHRHLADLLFAVVPLRQGDSVVDLCTGTGIVAREAARRVGPDGSVLGIDFASEMLDAANEKARQDGLSNIEFSWGDVESIELQDSSYDVAFCSAAAVWLDSLPAALLHWRAALKIGGFVAFNGWSASSFVRGNILQQVGPSLGVAVPDWHGQTGTVMRCQSLLERAGYEVFCVHEEDMSRFENPEDLKRDVDSIIDLPTVLRNGSKLADIHSVEQINAVKEAYKNRVDELTSPEGVRDEIMTYTIVGRRIA